MKNILLIVTLYLGCACTTKKIDPPTLGPDPDPVIVVQSGSDKCQDACDKMSDLGCEEGTPLPLEDGGTIACADLCIYDHENGVSWNTECLTTIKTCLDIEALCNP